MRISPKPLQQPHPPIWVGGSSRAALLRAVAGQSWRAWRKAEQLFDAGLQAETAAERIRAALLWFAPDGSLWTRASAQAQLHQASELLSGQQWNKVRRILGDERTLSHLDRLPEQLAEAVPESRLREALSRLWFVSDAMQKTEDELEQLPLTQNVTL
jgi:alkanesulfonate monooxygenase SsuD/methylene tetrahydromethanopterin reductase-like flavin-dependent oxidoreductase (luciferase family)